MGRPKVDIYTLIIKQYYVKIVSLNFQLVQGELFTLCLRIFMGIFFSLENGL